MDDGFQTGPTTKPFQYFFRLIDIAALELAYYLAYLSVPFVRNMLFPNEPPTHYEEVTYSIAFLIPLVWLPVLQIRSLYRDPARVAYPDLVSQLFQVTLVGLGIVALVLFAAKQVSLSRLLLVIFGVYSFLILLIVRTIEKWYFVHAHGSGRYAEKILLVGNADAVQKIHQIIVKGDSLQDCKIVGYLDSVRPSQQTKKDVPYLGITANLQREIANREVSEVLIVWNARELETPEELLAVCREAGKRVRVIPQFVLTYGTLERSMVLASAESFWGIPSIALSTVAWKVEHEFLKRLMDVLVSAVLLILLLPLFCLIALAIKISSPGPILYRMKAIGRNGGDFVYHKFRTMVPNADELKPSLLQYNEMQGPVFKMKNDPRITPVGYFLRKYSLDELPQLWSVLVGDMSLVGPRPPARSEFERFEFWQRRKLSVRPGITCLWQVNGRNQIPNFDEWVRLDLLYIDNWSLWLDLRILAKTALALVKGTGH
jgi:exopolysaccharide biosynthesis polyprenyl glycosylphosphotransferase